MPLSSEAGVGVPDGLRAASSIGYGIPLELHPPKGISSALPGYFHPGTIGTKARHLMDKRWSCQVYLKRSYLLQTEKI